MTTRLSHEQLEYATEHEGIEATLWGTTRLTAAELNQLRATNTPKGLPMYPMLHNHTLLAGDAILYLPNAESATMYIVPPWLNPLTKSERRPIHVKETTFLAYATDIADIVESSKHPRGGITTIDMSKLKLFEESWDGQKAIALHSQDWLEPEGENKKLTDAVYGNRENRRSIINRLQKSNMYDFSLSIRVLSPESEVMKEFGHALCTPRLLPIKKNLRYRDKMETDKLGTIDLSGEYSVPGQEFMAVGTYGANDS